MEPIMRAIRRESDSIRRLRKFHVAGLAGAIVAALSTVPFDLHDAMIHIDDDAQFIAVFACNSLAYLPT
jgi:hypothetical protein